MFIAIQIMLCYVMLCYVNTTDSAMIEDESCLHMYKGKYVWENSRSNSFFYIIYSLKVLINS